MREAASESAEHGDSLGILAYIYPSPLTSLLSVGSLCAQIGYGVCRHCNFDCTSKKRLHWSTLGCPEFVVAGIHVNMLKRKKPHRKRTKADSSEPVACKQRSIVGSKVQHGWREKTGVVTQWKGTVLDQLPVNPSLFLVKYDEFDCVYGIELFKDERVSGLEILPDKSGRTKILDGDLAELIVGKAVEHMFEKDDGSKNEWRGMVLARAPVMTTWYYITYEKDPVLYMYQLLEDYKEGDLRILPDSENKQVLPTEPGEVIESLVGKQVEYVTEDGTKRTGLVIHQVQAKPSVYFIKFDDDFHIYVYDLVKTS